MLRYVIRRVLYAIPILLGVSLLTFLLFYCTVTPEQMAKRNLSAKNPSPEQIQGWLREHGYDKPRSEQFEKHIRELFGFQFGNSDATGEPIWDKLKAGAGPSLLIGSTLFFAGLLTSITLSLYVAYYRGTYLDYWATFLCVLLMSINIIVYIVAGQWFFSKVLRLSPLAGYESGPAALKFILIPAIIGVLSGIGGSVRFYRTVILEEINQDYVRTARAKGIGENRVLFRHVLKNASIPILTSTVTAIPSLVLGGLLIESFFNIPGLGSLTVDAIQSQDFAVVRAMVFLGTVLYIIGLVLTDISYALFDPRVRLE
ncbi:MAG TPA: ABC transporter permease [Abditibacteriaceae bacterium]|jgi:peptide/nickel transport system permease protein